MSGSGPVVPGAEYFDKGQWGHDGSQWRKLALTWGYSDRWAEQISDLNASAGTNTLVATVVPAGEVWVLDFCGGVDVNSAVSIELEVDASGLGMTYVPSTAKAAGAWLIQFPIGLVLKEGDSARVRFYSCNLNDDLYARFWGYKMAVA